MTRTDPPTTPEPDDDPVITAVRAHFDAAGANVTALPDPADVRRRLRRRTGCRSLGTGALATAAAIVTVVAMTPGHAQQRVTVRTHTQPAISSADTAQDEARRLDGDPPGVVVALHRTTPDELRFRTLVLDTTKDPRSYVLKRVPDECVRRDKFDIVAQLPGGGFGWASIEMPVRRPGEASVQRVDLWSGTPDSFPKLPGGAVDPRTSVQPLPGATPTPTDLSSAGAAVVAHADGLRSLRVTFDNGRTDEAEAIDGYAIAGTLATRTPTTIAPPVAVSSASLIFEDGRTVDLDGIPRFAEVADPDGHPRQSLDNEASLGNRCLSAPLELPDAGPGPDDPAAASAAVTTAVETAAKGALPIDERVGAFVDPDWARSLVAELGDANVAGVADSSARMKGLVFTSPTTAIVQFDLQVPSVVNGMTVPASMVTDVFGKVVLLDGKWVITSESICKLVSSVAPTSCREMVTNDYPPEVYG